MNGESPRQSRSMTLEFLHLLRAAAAPATTPPPPTSGRDLALVDWSSFVVLAEWHRLIPQAYQFVKSLTGQVPTEPLDDLRRRFEFVARHNVWRATEYVRIVRQLSKHGISTRC